MLWSKTTLILTGASLFATVAQATPDSRPRTDSRPDSLLDNRNHGSASQDDFSHTPPGGGPSFKRDDDRDMDIFERSSILREARVPLGAASAVVPGKASLVARRGNNREPARGGEHVHHDGGKGSPSGDDFSHTPQGGGPGYRRGEISAPSREEVDVADEGRETAGPTNRPEVVMRTDVVMPER
ncbi:hypothetical protein K437DRAFT_265082 [Tilletiaria anomala UBC 951]|uniref:Uncharacterized protein n=1 Tax=Tilletiaria anomala (strain ATCC 24038 / CBS 436.72 / UBC 951) TaxID=1037660 RepID=A0A066V6F1_TILAU|nr:uncharacterized protein K437DRAFT_265082 [Tilletiaria anomala UBC 951]KDN37322.1 hypothetical protein K437DRAFT_265082 [Tilletiaria anomala UBC 951]